MKRRAFISLLGGAAVWPLAARAQQSDRIRRIGVLMGYDENDLEAQTWVAAFRQALQNLGWTEGRNIRIDTRWGRADTEMMQRFAQELVEPQPDLIVSQITPTTEALLQRTRTIPIDKWAPGGVPRFLSPDQNGRRFSVHPRLPN